jgi:Orn/Lys/Arg decarboxylase, N-terminal domain
LIWINLNYRSDRYDRTNTHAEVDAMEFWQAFPIAIDEDYEGKQAARVGMRHLAEAIEKQGWRVLAGVSYADAHRLAEVFNSEACWLVSVDGAESNTGQRELLESILAAKRRRNDRLPIFPFGDERTAEIVPASVLKHANAFMRLFEDSPEFLARAIARSAERYLERLPPPMFKALMDYTPHASYSWHTRGLPAVLPFARARLAISSINFSARTRCGRTSRCRSAGSARCSTTPGRSPRANATRPAFSAPTRRCLSSGARRPRTRSSGMARWRAAAAIGLNDLSAIVRGEASTTITTAVSGIEWAA